VTLSVGHNGDALCSSTIGTFSAQPCVTNASCITAQLNIPNNGCGTNNNLEVEIPLSGLPSVLGTAAQEARLTSVDLILLHTSRSQLNVSLRSPSGQVRNLILGRAGFGDNYGSPVNCPETVFTLRDSGASLTSLTGNGMSNLSGIYAPEEPLSGFTGDPNGVWKLILCDDHLGDVGTLRYVRLNIEEVDCVSTQLVDDVINFRHSCGLTNVVLDGSQHLWAQYIPAATTYEFRFFEPLSGTVISTTSASPMLAMEEWHDGGLEYGSMYAVRVRASTDGGLNFCDWGTECTITTASLPPMSQRGMETPTPTERSLRLSPVPNNGSVLDLIADGLSPEAGPAMLEIYTMDGQLALRSNIPVNDGSIRYAYDLGQRLTTGVYLLNLSTANDQRMQRLIIE
jgi:subtilisin-like proprotein convertase family protein